jgi:hypothetical protein
MRKRPRAPADVNAVVVVVGFAGFVRPRFCVAPPEDDHDHVHERSLR